MTDIEQKELEDLRERVKVLCALLVRCLDMDEYGMEKALRRDIENALYETHL